MQILPIALETASCPLTLHMPWKRTMPPCWLIRASSSGLFGLCGSTTDSAFPFLTNTACESPTHATCIILPLNRVHTAVVPLWYLGCNTHNKIYNFLKGTLLSVENVPLLRPSSGTCCLCAISRPLWRTLGPQGKTGFRRGTGERGRHWKRLRLSPRGHRTQRKNWLRCRPEKNKRLDWKFQA